MKKIKLPKSEKILSFSAILLSLCTLIVFLYQTNLIRQQQYMSVYPYLEIGYNGINTKEFSFTIENNGVGPAIIEELKVGNEGELRQQDFVEFFFNKIQSTKKFKLTYSNLYGGQLITPNKPIEIFKSTDTTNYTSDKLYGILKKDNMTFEITYSSIYGEKWKITNKSAVPIKLKH